MWFMYTMRYYPTIKEWNPIITNKKDEIGRYHFMWNKPDTQRKHCMSPQTCKLRKGKKKLPLNLYTELWLPEAKRSGRGQKELGYLVWNQSWINSNITKHSEGTSVHNHLVNTTWTERTESLLRWAWKNLAFPEFSHFPQPRAHHF